MLPQTAIEGGSFLTNLKNDAVSDVAAAGAYAIGNAFSDTSGFWTTSNPLYAAEHAALGCAASAAEGTGFASGAIGGAASALVTPLTLGAIDPNHDPLTTEQTAIATAISMLAGGGIAGALGQNANAAATAAANEALNNGTRHWVNALICFLCISPPQGINGQTDAGSGPMDPKDVVESIKPDDVKPLTPDPFGRQSSK